jgi:hypothetical protein
LALRWLASFSCALLCFPLLAHSGAEAQTSPAVPSPALEWANVSSPHPGHFDEGSPYGGHPGNSRQETLSASTAQPMQWAFNRELWTADDAIPAPSPQNLDSGIASSGSTVDKSDCRWSFGVSSTWSCKIKPLTKYDFPARGTLRHLWPLHGKGSN